MGDTTKCVYQFFNGEHDKDETKIIKYFIMHGLGLLIKVDSYVKHMFYAWSLSHNTEVPISIRKNTYFIPLNTYTNLFYLGAGNANKTKT